MTRLHHNIFETLSHLWLIYLVLQIGAYYPTPGEVCFSDVCEYHMVIRRAQTMTYTDVTTRLVYDVTLNNQSQLVITSNNLRLKASIIGTVVDPSAVVTADGFQRDVILINNQFPGPTIQVVEGAQIKMTVYNQLSEVTSIHWHGLYQRKTNFMDGVPYLTQCPILPRLFFTYIFKAEPSGTHWYHSHYVTQRFDGLYGMLIVHKKAIPVVPSFSVFVSDWYHEDSDRIEVNHASALEFPGSGSYLLDGSLRQKSTDDVMISNIGYVSSLLGGRGRWQNQTFPLQKYTIKDGETQRFRMAHSGASYAFEMSVDGHLLILTACDGHDIEQTIVDSFVIHPGESMDFDVIADQEPSIYWMRAQRIAKASQLNVEGARAILIYESAKQTSNDPVSSPRNCTQEHPCKVFSCPFENFPSGYNKSCIAVDKVKSTAGMTEDRKTFDERVEEIFLNFAFVAGSTVNGRKFVTPRTILLQNQDNTHYYSTCDEVSCRNGCSCTNIITLPFNKSIDLILTNYEIEKSGTQIYPGHHSVHLHGHSFAVLKMGFAPLNSTGYRNGSNSDVTCTEPDLCSGTRWKNDVRPTFTPNNSPAMRDTVIVPAQGYTVIRIRTDNPGLWLLHCHMDLHTLHGMAVMLDVAPRLHLPLPNNFPVCQDFNLTIEEHMKYLEGSTSKRDVSTPTLEDKIGAGNYVYIRLDIAIGFAFGLVGLGGFLVVIPALLCLCVRQRWTVYKTNN